MMLLGFGKAYYGVIGMEKEGDNPLISQPILNFLL